VISASLDWARACNTGREDGADSVRIGDEGIAKINRAFISLQLRTQNKKHRQKLMLCGKL
jgi:hypothetical protein